MKNESLFRVAINNLVFFLVSAIIICGAIFNSIRTNYIISEEKNNNELILEQIVDSFNNNLEVASLVTATIANNTEMNNLIYKWSIEESNDKKNELELRINKALGNQLSYNNLFEGVVFELRDKNKFVYGNSEFYYNNFEDIAINSMNGNRVNLAYETLKKENVILVIPIKKRITVIENVFVILNKKVFDTGIGINKNKIQEISLLSNKDLQEVKKELDLNQKKYSYYDSSKLNRFDLNVLVKYDLMSTKKIINKIDLISAMSVGAMIIIVLIFYYRKFNSLIVKPIEKTVSKINRMASTREFNQVFEKNKIKEINDININLNNMINELNFLIKENKIISEEKLENEIKVLQSQITSHFIVNTINSIRILALINDDKEVGEALHNFIVMISKNFTKGNMHTLEEEIQSIQSYCELMKLRYGEIFNIYINLNKNIKYSKVLKLIIQPIIENSIFHGIGQEKSKCNITVNLFEDDGKIFIHVIDDGIGLDEKTINDILNGNSSGIGIYNSNRRIKLHYGDEYGIKIESELGGYTKIIVMLPIIDE